MKDTDYFLTLMLKTMRKKSRGYEEYGSREMPVLQVFKGLKTVEEKRAFVAAMETMLADNDPAVRRYAVSVCVGFVLLRDVV